jgi:hypothetical protein
VQRNRRRDAQRQKRKAKLGDYCGRNHDNFSLFQHQQPHLACSLTRQT